MIISDEQAKLAADYLRHPSAPTCHKDGCQVPSDVLAQAMNIASLAPDVREERVAEAKIRLEADVPADEIAAKMLSRIVSDALR